MTGPVTHRFASFDGAASIFIRKRVSLHIHQPTFNVPQAIFTLVAPALHHALVQQAARDGG